MVRHESCDLVGPQYTDLRVSYETRSSATAEMVHDADVGADSPKCSVQPTSIKFACALLSYLLISQY